MVPVAEDASDLLAVQDAATSAVQDLPVPVVVGDLARRQVAASSARQRDIDGGTRGCRPTAEPEQAGPRRAPRERTHMGGLRPAECASLARSVAAPVTSAGRPPRAFPGPPSARRAYAPWWRSMRGLWTSFGVHTSVKIIVFGSKVQSAALSGCEAFILRLHAVGPPVGAPWSRPPLWAWVQQARGWRRRRQVRGHVQHVRGAFGAVRHPRLRGGASLGVHGG